MKTDPNTINLFLVQARDRAVQMMENGSFILRELPSLRMPDALRKKLEALCSELIGTKHDLIHEIFEIGELMESSPEPPALVERIDRMLEWIFMSTMGFQDCVEEVQRTVKNGEADGLLSILITESGVNILSADITYPTFRQESQPASVLTPKEREELLDACRQAEALRRAKQQEEPYEEKSDKNELYEENDEEDEDTDDSDPNCYAFYSEDSYPVGQLVSAIRRLMARTDLPADTVANLKVFLFAMERLPLVTPGVKMSLALRLDQGGESDWIEIRMEDGEFSLGRGTWVDGDADTETVFEVTPDYRDGDAFIASQFAQSFIECARDVCREVVIENFSDEPFTGWNLEPDKKRWGSLPCSFL